MKLNIKNRARSAFTVVELIIVIAVIAILATVTIVAYNGVQQNAHQSALLSDLDNSAAIMARDLNDNGAYATSVTAADGGNGLPTNSGTTYQYTVNNSASPPTFCLTGTNGNVSYYINSTTDTPTKGGCPGDSINGAPPLNCPTGFIIVPGSTTYGTSNFCVMKYEAKQASSTVPISQAAGSPWVNISQTDAITYSANVAGCTGCHLITEAEWLTIAQNVMSVASNWSGGAVGSGYIYSGHNDNAPANALAADTNDANGYIGETNTGGNQRRTLTLSNGAVIWDFAGNVWEWTSSAVTGGQPGVVGGGYAWREWPAITSTGSLPNNPNPAFGTPAAAAWTSAQGIGQIYSSADDTTNNRAIRRSSSWAGQAQAGIFTLYFGDAPTFTDPSIGFRVTR